MQHPDKALKLSEIARLIDAELQGDPDKVVCGLEDLTRAGDEHISFLSAAKYVGALTSTKAGAVILSAEHSDKFAGNRLIVANPYVAYARLSGSYRLRQAMQPGIHPTAIIDPSAVIGKNVAIGAYCSVGAGAHIGDHAQLHQGVVIGDGAVIGENNIIFHNSVICHGVKFGTEVVVYANATIGSDGFGYAPTASGWEKIHQLGTVVVGDRVEIGANTTIDRGALGDTIIGNDVIIDNQIHIGHNCEIGDGSALAGCAGVAGSTRIGKRCMIGGAVMISGHLDIADGTQFNGGTVVSKGNNKGGVYASSTPLQEAAQWRRNSARFRQLDELFDRVKKLERASKN